MTREDQRIVSTVIDLVHRFNSRQDAKHAARVRRHLRAALDTIGELEAASARAARRGYELTRRDEAARRWRTE